MSESTTGGTDQVKTGEGAGPDVAALQEQLNAAIAERDTMKTQLRDLKNASKGSMDLQKQYDELMAKHSALTEEYGSFKTSVVRSRTDSFLQTALEASNAHNAERVKAMLDMSKLKIADDGTPDKESVAEAILALKKSDPYLFKADADTSSQGNAQTSGSTSVQLPGVKLAQAAESTDPFKLALAEAKKAKDPFKAIEDVLKKYGKSPK